MDESSEAEEHFGQVNSDEERYLFQQQQYDDENEKEEETIRRRVKPGKRVKKKKNQTPTVETPKNETFKDWYYLYQENTLPKISFHFGIQWNDSVEENNVVSFQLLFS